MRTIFRIFIIIVLSSASALAQNVKVGKGGNIVFGPDSLVRAISPFHGTAEGGAHYTAAINAYRDSLPDINIYSMIVPISSQFYCPAEVASKCSDQAAVIKGMYNQMPKVRGIEITSVLKEHVNEEIYSRTDHHWFPLAAYYAAKVFAEIAKVDFKDLSYYDKHVVKRFVGSMYNYSKDIRVKQSPENFVYYTPKDSSYVTTYVGHKKLGNGKMQLLAPTKGPFFKYYKDGSSSAYCTFMGGDSNTTHVKAMGKNGRKLLLIKDSFGNAIPGYLFYSFSDIYVTDFRYFQENIITYIREHGVTDLLIVNNMQHAYSKGTSTGLIRMLNN